MKWSDVNTSATRSVTVNSDLILQAIFAADTMGGNENDPSTDSGTDDNPGGGTEGGDNTGGEGEGGAPMF